MINSEQLQYLYQQYQAGNLTETETQKWRDIVTDLSTDKELFALLDADWYRNDLVAPPLKDGTEQKIYQFIVGQPQTQRLVKKRKLWPRIAAAASIVIVLSFGGYFLLQKTQINHIAQTATIKPGTNEAYLTLGNGERISLTNMANGVVARQSGIAVQKTSNGMLVYTRIQKQNSNSDELIYNTVETPRGGQYQVVLPDGTEVWLNAASSLKYPASFASQKYRKVELKGEAYFQVSKDKDHPFVVKTNAQEVLVLGTHFNINAYQDENGTTTTLLEGKVKVWNDKGSKILKPGECALEEKGLFKVDQADIDGTMAWKNGYLSFNNEDLQGVMRKISRWYDVDVEYRGKPVKEGFNGTMSKYKSIDQLLKMLESTGSVHFKIEGRRIIVY